MLTAKAQYNLANAQSYFSEHLEAGEYYSQNRKVRGCWVGRGARMLGLKGDVREKDFLDLCEGLDPRSGEFLTQRKKTVRNTANGQTANRRVFYDFTISPPKSVSIMALVAGDERVAEVHRKAVDVAINELESFTQTRIRRDGVYADRDTGNFVAATFEHDTSRMLDPHLHTHCVVFNATWDAQEDRWKALQNRRMFQAQKYVENEYYHKLARELRRLGYEVENKTRGDFEIKGVDQDLIDLFSKRHDHIDQALQVLLNRHPEKGDQNIAEMRELLALEHRPEKERNVDPAGLAQLWSGQITEEDQMKLQALRSQNLRISSAEDVNHAFGYAVEHLFERKSVAREDEILRTALEHARGGNFSVADLKQALNDQEELIRFPSEPHKLTTQEIITREAEIVEMAKAGRFRHTPFATQFSLEESGMSAEQSEAAKKLLQSCDFLTVFRGGAGTGKSFTLRFVKKELERAGHPVAVVAPQRQQVIGLEADGLGTGQTLSELLTRRELPDGAVVLLDEAGQVGARQMHDLLTLIQERNGRIICSGDTRQHGSVEASDALWAIEKYANLYPVELNAIRRQDPAKARSQAEREQIEKHREAVEHASRGKVKKSFGVLEDMGVIQNCHLGQQQSALAEAYLQHALAGESTVVVSQTWSEIHKVNQAVRQKLQQAGMISRKEVVVKTLEPVDATTAQKKDAAFLQKDDQIILMNRPTAGFAKGERVRVLADTGEAIILESESRVKPIRKTLVDRLSVYREQEMPIAKGDQLQLKSNGKSTEGKRLANGELVNVQRVLMDGRIRLVDGRTLPAEYRQFVRGFAVTSYGSQGKTVDHVLFSDSAVKAATNRRQFYVTISRGRKSIRIFTTDPQQLKEDVETLGQDDLALDLANAGNNLQQTSKQALQTSLRIAHNQLLERRRQQTLHQGRGLSP